MITAFILSVHVVFYFVGLFLMQAVLHFRGQIKVRYDHVIILNFETGASSLN